LELTRWFEIYLRAESGGPANWKRDRKRHEFNITASPGSGASAQRRCPYGRGLGTLKGGYYLQVHLAPDVIERRIYDLDLSKEFLARGLRGFVLKSHLLPTASARKSVTLAVPGIAAY